MAGARSNSPIPSTSGTQASKIDSSKFVSIDEDETLTLRSLDLISKIASMLRTEADGFFSVLENILMLVDGNDSDTQNLKYGMVENVMSSILEADAVELISAKQYFEPVSSKEENKKMAKKTNLRTIKSTSAGDKSGLPVEQLNKRGSSLETEWKNKPLLIKKTDLMVLKSIYMGRTYCIYLGQWRKPNGSWKKVGIRRAISANNDKFIEKEAAILSQLHHKNIVEFYGKHESEPEIVIEFMDLDCYIKANKRIHFTTQNIFRILGDVASGMEYLAEKQILHRNLLLTNVLLNKKKQCKIGGFEFAVHVAHSDGVCVEKDFQHDYGIFSPETFRTKTFTMMNEVWMMGLLCYDIFEIVESPDNLLKMVLNHNTFCLKRIPLPKSKNCPYDFHQYVTKEMLNENPIKRPNITAIRLKIKKIASTLVK